MLVYQYIPIYVYTSLCRVNCDDDFLIPSMLSADPRENRSRPKLRSYDLPKIVGNFPQSILRWRPEVRWLQCSRAALHLIRNKMYTQQVVPTMYTVYRGCTPWQNGKSCSILRDGQTPVQGGLFHSCMTSLAKNIGHDSLFATEPFWTCHDGVCSVVCMCYDVLRGEGGKGITILR